MGLTKASEVIQTDSPNQAKGVLKQKSLMERLSSFETKTEKKTESCDEHGGYIAVRSTHLRPSGEAWGKWSGCPECMAIASEIEAQAESEKRREEHSRRQKEGLGFHTVPKRFRDKNFDAWNAEGQQMERVKTTCQRYAENFAVVMEKGVCLTLCGNVGTGKTHLAAAIVNQLTDNGYSAQYISLITLVKAIKDSWSNPETSEREIMRQLERVDLLVLDEIGVQYGTDTEKLILFELINARYEDMKPTVIVSNLKPDDLKDYVGERVFDRLKEGGAPVLGFGWESARA